MWIAKGQGNKGKRKQLNWEEDRRPRKLEYKDWASDTYRLVGSSQTHITELYHTLDAFYIQ